MTYSYDGLDRQYVELAKKELKEDPKKVLAHIASLRNWLRQSRHIQNCPDDDAFLLRHLRIAKFDHEAAQSRLENFCTLRGSKERGLSVPFIYPSPDDARFKRFMEFGFQIPCRFIAGGELVVVAELKHWDPSEISFADRLPFVWAGMDAIWQDERTQIAGISMIMDMNGVSKKHVDGIVAQLSAMKSNARFIQEGSPMRIRNIFFYRMPVVFEIIFNVLKIWMKPKLLKRIHQVKDDLKKIHDALPGAKEALPEEYGGNNGTMAELRSKWRQRMDEYLSEHHQYNSINVDESLRPKETLKFLREYKDIPSDIYGAKGTYTKLETD